MRCGIIAVAPGFCWAALGAPTGKHLASIMDDLVPRLRRLDELDITDGTEMVLIPDVAGDDGSPADPTG